MTARRKGKKRSGVHPGVAVALLLGSAGFAIWSLAGSLGGGAAARLVDLVAPADEEEVEEAIVSDVVWLDLLAAHGSFDGSTSVPMVFAPPVPESSNEMLPAAPGGETSWSGEWRGEDPPLLHVSVLLVHGAVRRAVVDGQVLGIGDRVGNGRILAIEPGCLRLEWQRRELVYDFTSDVPREFRAELSRRGHENSAASDASDTADEREDMNGRKR